MARDSTEAWTEVLHEQIVPDPHQARRVFDRIESLADSIKQKGLMQNLVVRQDPQKQDIYILIGGERRWRAIARLIDSGDWPRDKPIPVLNMSTDGVFESLIENDAREPLLHWDFAKRVCALLDADFTQQEIAAQLSCSKGRISRLSLIGEGLSPEAIESLNRYRKSESFTLNELAKIANLRKVRSRNPDPDAQVRAIETLVRKKQGRVHIVKPPGKVAREKNYFWNRFQKLKQEPIGSNEMQTLVIERFVDYLSGDARKLRLDDLVIEECIPARSRGRR